MNPGTIRATVRAIAYGLKKNSPSILTAFGVAGVISTTILAVKATPKALDIIKDLQLSDDGESDVKPQILDIVKATYKVYIPTTVMGFATIMCILSVNNIHTKRTAAIASLYSLTDVALKEYQAKVAEKMGSKKELAIQDSVAQDAMDKIPLNKNGVIISGDGTTLCFDVLTGRYFNSDIESIRRIQNDFNEKLLSDMYLTLNSLYFELGLDPVSLGDDTGWRIEKGKVDIAFGAKIAKHGIPCIVVDHRNKPIPLWG